MGTNRDTEHLMNGWVKINQLLQEEDFFFENVRLVARTQSDGRLSYHVLSFILKHFVVLGKRYKFLDTDNG